MRASFCVCKVCVCGAQVRSGAMLWSGRAMFPHTALSNEAPRLSMEHQAIVAATAPLCRFKFVYRQYVGAVGIGLSIIFLSFL